MFISVGARRKEDTCFGILFSEIVRLNALTINNLERVLTQSSYFIYFNSTMSNKIYRVSQGAQLAGVCAGLEASGKGSALMWRLLFFFGAWFWFVGLVVYIYFACSWPKAKTIRDAQKLSGTSSSQLDGETSMDQLESELDRLAKMKDKGLIDENEFQAMRKKLLNIS